MGSTPANAPGTLSAMRWPDKTKVRDALIEHMKRSLERTSEAAQRTREGATHAEAKPENDKDTRALEQSYLARGQAMRVEDLAEQIQQLRFMELRQFDDESIASAGALVAIEVDDTVRMYWLAPYAGGTELQVDGIAVFVVTAGSPLGRAMLERGVGDDFKLKTRGAVREHVIIGLR